MTPPRKFSALPPQDLYEASPKAISRRTSYLRVRLEFLPYPHLIPTLFNGCGFGLHCLLRQLHLDMDRSPGFGSAPTDLALLRLGFPSAPSLLGLNLASRRNSPDRSTKSTRLDLSSPTACKHRFQVLFHSPPGVLFTFPSQYYALSVTKEYLALRGGPRFSHKVPRVSWYSGSRHVFVFSLTGLSPSLAGFPKTILLRLMNQFAVRTPGCTHPGLGSSISLAATLESMFLSLPPAT